MTAQLATIEPWERLANEGPKPWAAFCVYRDAGPLNRSLRAVADQFSRSEGLIGRWSRVHHWVERVRAYDDEQERQRRLIYRDELEKMARRQALLGQLIQAKMGKRMQNMSDEEVDLMSIWELTRMIELGVRLERQARSAPTLPDIPAPVQLTQVNVQPGASLLTLLRENPSQIGPVIEHITALRQLLPSWGMGGEDDVDEVIDDEDDEGGDEP